MKTRIEKLRQPGAQTVELRNKEVVVSPNAQVTPTEQLGVTQGHPNTSRVPIEQGAAVISPKLARQAKAIARAQSGEVSKLNKVLQDPNANPLARRTAERRLKALRSEYDPLIMAEAQSRAQSGGTQVNAQGIPTAEAGFAAQALGMSNPVTAALSAAPMLYNIGMGLFSKVEKLNPRDFYNPYDDQIKGLMANRRYNVNPQLGANKDAAAVANYDIRNAGIGAGAYASNRGALQNSLMRGNAAAYATKQNADNTYKAEEGNMLAGLGAAKAETNLIVSDINAQNKAAKQQMLSAGLSQLGGFAQNNQLMNNQAQRDSQLEERYNRYFSLMSDRGRSFSPAAKLQGVGFDPMSSINPLQLR